jgi:hypothetical protein
MTAQDGRRVWWCRQGEVGLHSVPDVSRPPYRIVHPQRIKVVPDDHRDRRTGCAALSIMEVLLQTIISVDTPPLAPFCIVVL